MDNIFIISELFLFQVIGECHSVRVKEEVTAKYRLMNEPQDVQLFLDFCLHTVLYQPSSQGSVFQLKNYCSHNFDRLL